MFHFDISATNWAYFFFTYPLVDAACAEHMSTNSHFYVSCDQISETNRTGHGNPLWWNILNLVFSNLECVMFVKCVNDDFEAISGIDLESYFGGGNFVDGYFTSMFYWSIRTYANFLINDDCVVYQTSWESYDIVRITNIDDAATVFGWIPLIVFECFFFSPKIKP